MKVWAIIPWAIMAVVVIAAYEHTTAPDKFMEKVAAKYCEDHIHAIVHHGHWDEYSCRGHNGEFINVVYKNGEFEGIYYNGYPPLEKCE